MGGVDIDTRDSCGAVVIFRRNTRQEVTISRLCALIAAARMEPGGGNVAVIFSLPSIR